MNKILKSIRDFARVYVDDIIAFSRTLLEYLKHLYQIFALFRKRRISLNPKKFFLRYSSVTLLRQRVDSLDLFTFEEKLIIINLLQFSRSLRELETFLELTE